jgi:hypothetical protein
MTTSTNLTIFLRAAEPQPPFVPHPVTLRGGIPGQAVECIPFSRRGCEPCYYVITDRGSGWYTDDDMEVAA